MDHQLRIYTTDCSATDINLLLRATIFGVDHLSRTAAKFDKYMTDHKLNSFNNLIAYIAYV